MIPSRTVSCGTATITYDLVFSRRKTLGISVKPDSQVTVRAPIGTPLREIERLVQKRATWILRHQRKFESYPPPSPIRQYMSGESHRYLGKQYRLEVTQAKNDSVKLIRGRFLVTARDNDPARVKRLLIDWYRRQARRIFAERLAVNYPIIQRYDAPYPEIKIRLMKKRWGSCSATSRINLNLRLIQAPKPYIDYVIIHELCHLIEHNHGRTFYALLDRLLPDWRRRRQELNQLDIA
jgi:predicted metal-dependent hydrolase